MAATGYVFCQVQITIGSDSEVFPQSGLNTPVSFSAATEDARRDKVTVGTSAAVTLWEAGGEMTDFIFLMVKADQALWLSWERASGASDNASVQIPAGMPFFLPSGTFLDYRSTNEINEVTPTVDAIGKVVARAVSVAAKVDVRIYG